MGSSGAGIATLLASCTPFATEDVNRIRDSAARLGFDVLLLPGHRSDTVLSRLAGGRDLAELVSRAPLDISAPTDDRPFFFNLQRPRDVFDTRARRSPEDGAAPNALGALSTLLALALVLSLFLRYSRVRTIQ